MRLVLTKKDFKALSPATRAELVAKLLSSAKVYQGDLPPGFKKEDFEGVVDLTPDQVLEFMEGCSMETIAGLKVFAEHGPAIHGSLLDEAGIENYGHFQGRVTKRTRTITKDKDAYLFGWDDWTTAPDNIGHYAVTPATYRSLRVYFDLD